MKTFLVHLILIDIDHYMECVLKISVKIVACIQKAESGTDRKNKISILKYKICGTMSDYIWSSKIVRIIFIEKIDSVPGNK